MTKTKPQPPPIVLVRDGATSFPKINAPCPPGHVTMMKPKCRRTWLNRFASMFGWKPTYEVTCEFEVRTHHE